jgi:hypothetical protein
MQRFSQGIRFEHIPIDVDGNGAVSSQLTIPNLPVAGTKALIESIAQTLDLTNTTHYWNKGRTYVIEKGAGDCTFSFSHKSNQATISYNCSPC